MDPFDFRHKTVLVTGASKGIGAEFARQLSKLGATLVLVARSREQLDVLAEEIGDAHVVSADLAKPGAAELIQTEVEKLNLDIDVLVNNAGFGLHGSFESLGLDEQRGEIDLNVTALYELTYLFLPGIVRRRGGVLNVCSVAGYGPIPYMSVYAATKAFVLSFSQALWAECEPRGVRVTCLSPGATNTAFFERSGSGADPGTKAEPSDVAKLGIDAFVAGRASVVHGRRNRLLILLSGLFPLEFMLRSAAKMLAPQPILSSETVGEE